MALDFDGPGAPADYLQDATMTSVATLRPGTLACWFNPDALSTEGSLVSVSNGGDSDRSSYVYITAGDVLTFVHSGATSDNQAATGGSVSAGTWQHMAATVDASNMVVYLDGSSSSTAHSVSANPSANRVLIAISAAAAFTGRIAEVAYWTTALDAAEVEALAEGISPLLVRPQSLHDYWPLWGRHTNEPGLIAGNSLSEVGTPVYADHPRMIYASALVGPSLPGIAAGTPATGTGGGGVLKNLALIGVGR